MSQLALPAPTKTVTGQPVNKFNLIAGRRIQVEESPIKPGRQRRYVKPAPPREDKADPKDESTGTGDTDADLDESGEFYYCYDCQDIWDIDDPENDANPGCIYCDSLNFTVVKLEASGKVTDELNGTVVESSTALVPFFHQ